MTGLPCAPILGGSMGLIPWSANCFMTTFKSETYRLNSEDMGQGDRINTIDINIKSNILPHNKRDELLLVVVWLKNW